MLEAPVGLAFFGPDLRFRWVNAALARLAGRSGPVAAGGQPSSVVPPGHALAGGSGGVTPVDPSDPLEPAGYAGRLPSEVWPEELAARAEAALRKVLADDAPVPEHGYPLADPASAEATGHASWFPVHDAAGEIAGAGLMLLELRSHPA